MAALYADSVYYLAILNPRDRLSAAASTSPVFRDAQKVTSDPILVEVLAYMGERGAFARQAALTLIDELRHDPRTSIVRQTPELFDAGLELYRRRPDKGYSLTDCMSMVICGEQEVTQVLTHDQHFSQEGFKILL